MDIVQKKVCLLGDFAVGKTSLVRRYVEGRFDDRYLSTIGVKITRKTLKRSDYTLNMLIWDLAGGDDYARTETSYLRGASGAIIVCDLTRPETLAAYARYVKQLQRINDETAVVFVANKSDLVKERTLADDQILEACQALGTDAYLLTSAKSGAGVEEAFERLAKAIEMAAP